MGTIIIMAPVHIQTLRKIHCILWKYIMYLFLPPLMDCLASAESHCPQDIKGYGIMSSHTYNGGYVILSAPIVHVHAFKHYPPVLSRPMCMFEIVSWFLSGQDDTPSQVTHGKHNQGSSFYIRRYAAAYHLRLYIYIFKIKISYLGLFISI